MENSRSARRCGMPRISSFVSPCSRRNGWAPPPNSPAPTCAPLWLLLFGATPRLSFPCPRLRRRGQGKLKRGVAPKSKSQSGAQVGAGEFGGGAQPFLLEQGETKEEILGMPQRRADRLFSIHQGVTIR